VETQNETGANFDPNFGSLSQGQGGVARETGEITGSPRGGSGGDAPSPDDPPWGVLLGVGVTLASFFLLFVVQLVFVIPYIWSFHTLDPVAIAEIAKSPKAIFLAIVSIIPAHLLTLGVAWTVVTGFGKRPFLPTLGWSWSPRLGFWSCAGLAILMLGVGRAMVAVFGDAETELERMVMSSAGARYAVAALATFTAPLVEEVVFRGVLYSGLRKRLGVAWAASVVIIIFAAIHVPQYWPNGAAISTILILSAALTIVRARTGRLLPCVVIHFLFNGITSVLIVLEPFIEHKIPTPPTPPTPGALVELCAHLFTKLF
jgi:membrane protease YdiL (CAAX protease family)